MIVGGFRTEFLLDIIKQAKVGSIVPVYTKVDYIKDSVGYFAKLSDYGRKKHSILLESADVIAKYGENSLGSANPCLKLQGCNERCEIIALNDLGKNILEFLGDFDFCDEVEYSKNCIRGVLKPKQGLVSEDERLKLKTHMDIIRKVAFKFKPTLKPFMPYAGVFGIISYDFIDQFEVLPKNKKDELNDPDYELYFLDNLFLTNHKKQESYFIANALIMDEDRIKIYEDCLKTIDKYKKAINSKVHASKIKKIKLKIKSDTSKEEFEDMVKKVKKHIVMGDVFQAVISRTFVVDYSSEPLDIYKNLRNLNPSPYMYFINTDLGILLGASPETNLRVIGDKEKVVEIRPIAGTKPRGIIEGKIDKDLDSRYETELKIDKKELAEHAMLVDLARNDIARISKPGTRYVDDPFIVEKYSHVQHLVSNVRGILREDLDALHAYLATMNMGTLTGAPKVEAMKIIRLVEKTKRNYYGGAVLYITPNGDLDSAIIIRSIRLKNGKAYIRAGAGVVYDSIPEKEFFETEKKAQACLKAIRVSEENECIIY